MEDPLKLNPVFVDTSSAQGYEKDDFEEEDSVTMLERSGIMVSVQESGLLDDNKEFKRRIHSASSQDGIIGAGTTTPKVSEKI